ncbi:nicotinamide-nucleotide adenylyltransferase [Candidatus Woesearchaeota archaeon]|nr:nicotinamide-nucleotide adenylyltransferase [Candidatus Woesearchaeota archaeon]
MRSFRKKSIALYIGKFQPFHKGHLQIVKNILKRYDLIKIAVGSSQKHHQKRNPFTREERKRMIVAALREAKISKQRYKIYFVPDIPDDNKYPRHVRSIVGAFDIVFTGYWLNIKLFRQTKYRVHAIKRLFNISSTKIRKMLREENKNYKKMVPRAVDKVLVSLNAKKRLKEIRK